MSVSRSINRDAQTKQEIEKRMRSRGRVMTVENEYSKI